MSHRINLRRVRCGRRYRSGPLSLRIGRRPRLLLSVSARSTRQLRARFSAHAPLATTPSFALLVMGDLTCPATRLRAETMSPSLPESSTGALGAPGLVGCLLDGGWQGRRRHRLHFSRRAAACGRAWSRVATRLAVAKALPLELPAMATGRPALTWSGYRCAVGRGLEPYWSGSSLRRNLAH